MLLGVHFERRGDALGGEDFSDDFSLDFDLEMNLLKRRFGMIFPAFLFELKILFLDTIFLFFVDLNSLQFNEERVSDEFGSLFLSRDSRLA